MAEHHADDIQDHMEKIASAVKQIIKTMHKNRYYI